MICAGIDAGSRTIKIVLLDPDADRVMGQDLADQGTAQEAHVRSLLGRLLHQAGLTMNDLGPVVATGYGRNLLGFADRTITEITCHARGVRRVEPTARSIIEIGGQDSKVIRLDADGRVEDFAMNDRCAAGTGCFLELVARRLEVDLAELGALAAGSANPAAISSMCAVFAETEIIGLLAGGAEPAEIAAGVQVSIARRIAALAGRPLTPPIIFTGGVARAAQMDRAIADAVAQPVIIPPQPQMTGALGAALLAAESR
jgi:predicted CoA-substrate-specific enzyme activase